MGAKYVHVNAAQTSTATVLGSYCKLNQFETHKYSSIHDLKTSCLFNGCDVSLPRTYTFIASHMFVATAPGWRELEKIRLSAYFLARAKIIVKGEIQHMHCTTLMMC